MHAAWKEGEWWKIAGSSGENVRAKWILPSGYYRTRSQNKESQE